MQTSKSFPRTLDRVIAYIVYGFVFLLPLLFSPFVANVFDLPKRLLLIFVSALLFLLWSVKNILSKSFRLSITVFTLPLVLLAVANLISSWGPLPQMLSTLFNVALVPVALALLFLVASTNKTLKANTDKILAAIIASGVVLSFLTVLETIGFGPSRLISMLLRIPVAQGSFITPAGSVVVLVAYLLPTAIASILIAITNKNFKAKVAYLVSSAVITAAMVIAIFNLLPGKAASPTFLSLKTSWLIAAENIKHPRTFLIGVGPDNYIAAFSASRDPQFNGLPYWNVRFGAARNQPLQIFTTLGLVGLLAWGFLIYTLIRSFKFFNQVNMGTKASLFGLVILTLTTLLIPSSIIIDALFVFFLIVLAQNLKDVSKNSTELVLKLFAAKLIPTQKLDAATETNYTKSAILPVIVAVPAVLLFLAAIYTTFQIYAADSSYRNALQAISDNNGTNAYNSLVTAITRNPYSTLYRRTYASTNLALADAVSKKGNLSDQDKQTITSLVQQSIQEARNAVIVNPDDPTNWELLATIYRNIMGLAQDAPDWTVATYTEAIRRDPMSPSLRLDLGGVFYQLKDYSSATRLFEQTVSLKPDWANAHYNLAAAYAQSGDLQKSAEQYQATISLVDPASADYNKLVEEYNQLKAKLGEKAEPTPAPAKTSLTTPSPLPNAKPNEQINLNENSAPPEPGKSSFSDLTTPAASAPATP